MTNPSPATTTPISAEGPVLIDGRHLNLIDGLGLPVGYHGACWWTPTPTGHPWADRPIPEPLRRFLAAVNGHILDNGLLEQRSIGTAYLRVLDAGQPENCMRWHRDNQDNNGLRFTTAVTTGNIPVNMAFTDRPEWSGRDVADTPWHTTRRTPNSVIAAFTDQLHGVIPQPPRPGHKTAIYFTTLVDRAHRADLQTTNNTTGFTHAVLPTLQHGRHQQTHA